MFEKCKNRVFLSSTQNGFGALNTLFQGKGLQFKYICSLQIMARKKKKIERIEITGMGSEGHGFGNLNGKIIFVENTVPGDVVSCQIKRKRKGFELGYILRLLEPSDLRRAPVCEHFNDCGGCKWQHIPYEKQLAYKNATVVNAIERIAKQTGFETKPIIGVENEFHYRNKLEYTFSNKRWLSAEEIASGEEIDRDHALGFHVPGMFDKIVDISKCHLQSAPTNEIRNFVRHYAIQHNLSFYDLRSHEGLLRNLIIRNTSIGDTMVILCVTGDGEDVIALLKALADQFPEVTSWNYVVNNKKNDTIFDLEVVTYKGKAYLDEDWGLAKFKIGPKSFFQTNSNQARRLYDEIGKLIEGKVELLYDLYCGTGSIGLYLRDRAKRVVGIEYIEAAVEDARSNANLNGAKNATFYAGPMKEVLNFVSEKEGKPDLVITDPPRAGMHANVIQSLLDLEAPKIIYVSCNPATQARDIELLAAKYKLQLIQPIDLFPQTIHVENIALLTLNN